MSAVRAFTLAALFEVHSLRLRIPLLDTISQRRRTPVNLLLRYPAKPMQQAVARKARLPCMQCTVARASVVLRPPAGMDMLWVCRLFEQPEFQERFALVEDEAPGYRIRTAQRMGLCVVGMVHRRDDGARLGFVAMFAPAPARNFWEMVAAIAQPRHRNGFHMLHAVDAMSHLMFDVMGAARCGARVRADNAASLAVVRRLGHVCTAQEMTGGVLHQTYVLDAQAWQLRREKLTRQGAGAAPFEVAPA